MAMVESGDEAHNKCRRGEIVVCHGVGGARGISGCGMSNAGISVGVSKYSGDNDGRSGIGCSRSSEYST